ncbi:MAG TPA: SurA N-terminal domain-containing protein [Anaerolineales bacterium]|nr:SurA N-terminal domain-containing protein [Anaerolineales bacterium]
MRTNTHHTRTVGFLFVASLLLVACGWIERTPTPTLPPSATGTPGPTETSTPTPFPPSPTPEPLAATVNGEPISLAEYQAEMARYRAAQPSSDASVGDGASNQVLDDLIDQTLLAQGARENGFTVDDTVVQEHIDGLIEQVGGEGPFAIWLADQGYTRENFRLALARAIAAAWMRDWIIAKVPQVAEQVHARQILLYNSDQAGEVLAELDAGKDFATLSATYNPATLGELGWFPRGYLSDPAVEEAAFSLEPGEHSQVIKSQIGFQIIEVIERDPERPLDPDARMVLQEKAFRDWLATKRDQSEIEIFLP